MSAARREVDVRDLFAAEKKGHIVYTWDFHFGKRCDNGRKQRKENLSAPGRTAPTNCASSRSSAPAACGAHRPRRQIAVPVVFRTVALAEADGVVAVVDLLDAEGGHDGVVERPRAPQVAHGDGNVVKPLRARAPRPRGYGCGRSRRRSAHRAARCARTRSR